MLEIFNTIALCLLAVMSLLPIVRIRHWTIRGFDFPRLQICVALLLLGVLALVQLGFGRSMPAWWWLILALLILNHLWWIWPYSVFHAKQIPDHTQQSGEHADEQSSKVRILNCNVLMTNRQSHLLLDHINTHSPDIIAILESDHWWQAQLDTLEEYPHRVACPLNNKYGMHLYSKFTLTDTLINYLVEDGVPSISAQVHLPCGQSFHLHVIHPKPPAPGENESSTARDVELLVLAKALRDLESPIIVTGDLNDVAWSRTTRLFRRVSKLLDPRTGRGLFNTFHAEHWFARWPLDHVFVSTHFRICDIKRLGYMGSDHFPILVELSMTSPDLIDEPVQLNSEEQQLIEDTLQTELAKKAKTPDLR